MISKSGLSKHPFYAENIYNWANMDSPDVEPERSLYKSKFSSSVKDFYEKQKSYIPRTMGYMQTPLRQPHDYLKKHSGEKKLKSESKSVPCWCRELRQETSPDYLREIKSTPCIPNHSDRNFVMENSLLAQRRPATAPNPKIIDDRRGHSFDLEPSGWAPKYINKEDYGQKPKYIEDIDKNLEKSRNGLKEFLEAERQLTKPVKMSEEIKEKIFEGVVTSWKELLGRYLTFPVHTDTLAQRRRKLEIERRIDSLQEDIEFLMRNKDIFIGKHCYEKLNTKNIQ